MTTNSRQPLSGSTLALIWAVIALELLSPIPAFLTFGAAWVMLTRPPWFLRLVQRLYAEETAGGG